MNDKPDCAYCEFVTPGHRCYECYKLKPKQIRVRDRPSRAFRVFIVAAVTAVIVQLAMIHGLLVRIANKPPVIFQYELFYIEPEKEKPPMTHTINHVRKFHKAFGHPVAGRINPATKELRELRVKLIAEELSELCQALGVGLKLIVDPRPGDADHEDVKDFMLVEALLEDDEVDLVEAADALGDIDYVTQGANLVFGFPAEDVMNEIQRANMSKLGEDGLPIYREDGKIMKGPNYAPPDVAAVLKQHGLG